MKQKLRNQMKQFMKKVTLTLALFVGAISVSLAQSVAENKEMKKEKVVSTRLKVDGTKPVKKIEPVKRSELQVLPAMKGEAIIEEKETNQK